MLDSMLQSYILYCEHNVNLSFYAFVSLFPLFMSLTLYTPFIRRTASFVTTLTLIISYKYIAEQSRVESRNNKAKFVEG